MAGVDPSPDMVAFASKRHQQLRESGRLSFHEGTVSKVPFEDGQFDRAVSLNTVYFWPDLQSDLAEIRRVLKPGGRLLIGFRVARTKDGEPVVARNGGTSRPSDLTLEQLRAHCEQAGFVDSTAITKNLGRSLVGRYEAGMLVANVPGEPS